MDYKLEKLQIEFQLIDCLQHQPEQNHMHFQLQFPVKFPNIRQGNIQNLRHGGLQNQDYHNSELLFLLKPGDYCGQGKLLLRLSCH